MILDLRSDNIQVPTVCFSHECVEVARLTSHAMNLKSPGEKKKRRGESAAGEPPSLVWGPATRVSGYTASLGVCTGTYFCTYIMCSSKYLYTRSGFSRASTVSVTDGDNTNTVSRMVTGSLCARFLGNSCSRLLFLCSCSSFLKIPILSINLVGKIQVSLLNPLPPAPPPRAVGTIRPIDPDSTVPAPTTPTPATGSRVHA